MKFFFLLFISISIVFAQSHDTCYSVQLKSFKLKKNSKYNFEEKSYPKTCKLISFSNISTVRCGCYEKYKSARVELKKLSNIYPKPIIVNTYKYRFKKKIKSIKKFVNKPVQRILHKINKPKKKTLHVKQEVEQENKPSFLDNFSFQGNINLTIQSYMKAPIAKEKQNTLLSANLEAKYIKGNFTAFTKVRMQQDYYDLQGSTKYTNRSFIRLDELYGTYDFENDKILFGKSILFWGALEVRNIVNVFNPDELRADPFYTDKLGVSNITYTHYTQSGEFSAIVKLYEQNRKMSALPYVYYYFPAIVNIAPNVNLPLIYNDNLHTKASPYRPSIYLKYSDTTDTKYALDYAFIFENGYDSQRYFTKTFLSNNTVTSEENAYLVNKFMTYDTLVIGSTLYKLEATYADIIDDKLISDYIHLGFGAEHTLTQIYKDANLGLLIEYYRYISLQSGKKDDLALFELFQNDLFLGLRYSFNGMNDASIVSGGIFDLDYNEQVYYMEYQTRLMDTFKLNFDYRYISPSKNYNTAFKLMGAHERVSLTLAYYF